jgi:symplekin
MACVSSLLNIAKKRVDYVEFAVEVIHSLSYNLLESFTESQKNSIRKQLKVHCLNLIREPHAYDHFSQLEKVALSLGCVQSEISKAFQKASTGIKNKRSRSIIDAPLQQSDPKKAKELDGDDDETVELHSHQPLLSQLSSTHHRRKELSLIEEIVSVANQIIPTLMDVNVVIDTVIDSMKNLPSDIPQSFSQVYQVAHSPGTPEQIQETAYLLAVQTISVGMENTEQSDMVDQSASLAGVRARMKRVSVLGSPKEEKTHGSLSEVEQISEKHRTTISHIANSLGLFESILSSDAAFVQYLNKELDDHGDYEEDHAGTLSGNADIGEGGIAEILSTMQLKTRPKKTLVSSPKKMLAVPPQLHVQKLKKSRLYHISDLVKDSAEADSGDMGLFLFNRLLSHPQCKDECSVQNLQVMDLAGNLAREFDSLKDAFVQCILADPKKHLALISAWLYQEFVADSESLTVYEESLMLLLESCQTQFGPRNQIFSEIIQSVPCVTPGVLQMIEMFCNVEENSVLGLTTLKDLILNGCGQEDTCLQILFDATLSGSPQCRVNALAIAKKLHAASRVSSKIEEHLQNVLLKLVHDPPSDEDKHIVGGEWNENAVKLCLGLFCMLLPQNHHFLLRMAEVYAKTAPQVKRMILKQIESVICELPLSSKGVLTLIHQCPKGAETLVLRLLSLLVKSGVPPREVVESTKCLYEQSGKDVRFLIPVIKGLTKREIRDALPQIVSLSSGSLLKAVIHKLVAEDHSPINMTDLLILLHDVDCTDNDDVMKAIIKATTLCLADKALISSEVLVSVIKEVVRRSPLPVIFMRTVLQTLNMYPNLVDFIVTVLDELVAKEIWNTPKLWQGFVHCCEVAKPHSIPVVLKLPKDQLHKLSQSGTSLKAAIDAHLQSLPPEPEQDKKDISDTKTVTDPLPVSEPA